MAVEEQTSNNADAWQYITTSNRVGQRLPISNREVSKLAFLIFKVGSPTGDVTYTIRKVSDDSVIASKVLKDASLLQTTATWEEATFDSPVVINEEVRVTCEFSGGSGSNRVTHRYQNTDVKASEQMSIKSGAGAWTDYDYDDAYKYTYEEAAVGLENKSANMGARMVGAGLI